MELFLFCRQDSLDGDINLSCKSPPHKSKPVHMVSDESTPLASAWAKMDKLHLLDPCTDVKRTGEKTRPKSGLIVRGMMTGPTASSSQVGLLSPLLRDWGTGLQHSLVF